MARMRVIKPEFWDSPSTAQADLAVRLTYIAMWNWADDSGRGTANVKELEAFVFPNDDVTELPRKSSGNSADGRGTWRSFTEVLGEVAEAYGVLFYKVKNRPYYVIPQFKDHQSRDFRSKSKYPTEDEGHFYDVTSGNAISGSGETVPDLPGSAEGSGNSADGAGSSASVIGYEGTRVQGYEGKSVADGSGEPEGARAQDQDPPKPRRKPHTRIPDDWAPTDSHVEYCNARNIDLQTEAIAFRAHAEANDRTLANWNSGFTNWLTKARPRQQQPGPRYNSHPRKETAAEMYARLNPPQNAQNATQDYTHGHEVIDMGTDSQLHFPAPQNAPQRPTLTFPHMNRQENQ